MATCDASQILANAIAAGYDRLSKRDLIAVCVSSLPASTLEASVASLKDSELSEYDTAECTVQALCSSPGSSNTADQIIAAAQANKIDQLSRRDLDAVQVSLLCTKTNPPCSTPTAPINPTAKVITNTTILIIWNQVANTGSLITGYTVKWGTVTGVYTNSANVPAIPKSYTITGLTAGTQYFFVVVANSSAAVGCSSANSNEGNATTTGSAPSNKLLQSLISYWKFDNVSAATSTDSVGANNLALTNANSGFAGGLINGCLDVSTGSAHADHAANTDFNPPANTSFAFSMWVFSSAWTGNAGVLQIAYNGDGAANPSWQFYKDSNANSHKIAFLVWDSGSTVFGNYVTAGAPTNSVWHHIVGTYDSPSKTMTGYFDGVQIFQSVTNTNSILSSAVGFHFGPGAGNASVANFSIDEAALWHKSLTQADVTNLYNGGAGLPLSSFQA